MLLSASQVILQQWPERHRGAFAAMNADPEVMADLGGPLTRPRSDEKFERYAAAWGSYGISRWAIEDHSGEFLGYAGVMLRPDAGHPLGPHYELGWRLCRCAWGKGYASESAQMALDHAWRTISAPIIYSYTAPDNLRSQAVMRRLALQRESVHDFQVPLDLVHREWTGWVWVASRPGLPNVGACAS
jgi:RimJ/RimL family protein N-acetyltransferase